ncbi:UvrD-like helicase family protein [Luteococcus japonicus]|uniref:UvrD-like helicase family protein n=2 Tax=Luteococcus japonicus TaxID=33984 RepID=A0A3N1ZWE5_9ACTN|nr:UvrD-helicase domain-containing protein [Luteococcus japonicus]ROR55126.1 UvrD-like helicase family protein [Luteococcus japonicus]
MTGSLPRAGVVVAPAGYGKTHRVSEIIRSGLRVLVLTHTHVAVNNARRRQGVPHGVKLETIDAFARRLCLCFPTLSGVPTETTDWRVFEEGATAVLHSPAVATALAASYDQVVVDEFQDCSKKQVALLHALAALLPTLALGDPLQSLFDLLDPTQAATWEAKTSAWVDQEELTYPWRWHDQPDRGAWISRTRTALLEGSPVELDDPSTRVHRVSQQHGAYLSRLMRGPGSWAVIAGDAKNPNLPSTLAKTHPWNRLTVLEVGQPKELVDFTDAWESGRRTLAVLQLIKQCASNTTKVPGFTSCHANAATNKPSRSNAPLAALANQLVEQASPEAALALIDIVLDHPDTHLYRPQLLSRAQRALCIAQTEQTPLLAALARVDNQLRHMGNNPGNGPVVGSVLRMKGLEFDHVIIVQPERLDSPEEIYVALTRAKQTCTIVVKEGQAVPWLASP